MNEVLIAIKADPAALRQSAPVMLRMAGTWRMAYRR
jgi:hypothetical protein